MLFHSEAGAHLVEYIYRNVLLEGKLTSLSPAGELCAPQKLTLHGNLIIKEELTVIPVTRATTASVSKRLAAALSWFKVWRAYRS